MTLTNYFYKHATEHYADRVAIPELDRFEYMTPQYIEMFYEQLNSIKLNGTVGFIYSCGASAHQADLRTCSRPNYSNTLSGVYESYVVSKSMTAYMMHKYANILCKNGNDIRKVDIVSNTCASSLYAIATAEKWLDEVDHVVIISEEKTSFDTVRIFHEHRIDVKASDGFVCAVFSKEGSGRQITDCKTAFMYNNNPFLASAEGYKLIDTKGTEIVKVHGTGTSVNDKSEEEVFGDRICIKYKDKIGHSQGSSGLLELCMVSDEVQDKDILCAASGFGGFYASCIIKG